MPTPRDDLAGSLRRSVTRLARRLRAERGAKDLSPGEISALASLHRHGPLTVGQLAAEERTRLQSLTRPLAQLERRRLIRRHRDDADRRKVLLSITPAGSRLLVDDAHERRAWLARALATLSPDDHAVLVRAVELLDRLADTATPEA